ncbi:pyocin activator PrtN family protein [Chromohalobacter israelensis]|uniref:pyocin activator PrtN family protein n=1 Tax=Chromohalobacter israelensis TaxID=141390 RepID=UPI0016518C6D
MPAYRAGDSQKVPWLVSAVDLARYLDKRRAEAHEMWCKVITDKKPQTCANVYKQLSRS